MNWGDAAFGPRFWAKVVPEPNSGCWLWTGAGGRYGCITVDSKYHLTHRFVVERTRGPIPATLEVDHRCDNTRCVNPEHLRVMTHLDNMNRRAYSHRNRTKCAHGHEMTERNTKLYKKTKRCRRCLAAAQRRYTERKSRGH